MLTYDVLAVLWEAPASDVEVARRVEDRLALRKAEADIYVSRNLVEQHLRLLRTTGYVQTRPRDGAYAYVLTDAGSALLSQLAGGVEHEEYV
jgi:DNA-binding PadR family transcriptional regulator